MRSFITTLALSSLAIANPVVLKRQDINFAIIDANPSPTFSEAVGVTAQVVTYNTPSIIADATDVSSMTVDVTDAATATPEPTEAKMVKRGNCAAQPTGVASPSYSPDSASAFAAQTSFGDIASAAPTPSGYSQTFLNLNGSNNAYAYMGFTTLQTYDTTTCAAKCNKINGCLAVNIYFERDPSLDPGTNCPNPSSYTMIKCVFWGSPISASNAVNYGQWRQNFQVVIAGSNGYVNNSIATPPGFNTPQYIGNAAINAPYDSQGFNTYMGSNIFPPGPFNVQLCADFCTAQNTYNTQHPPTDGTPVQTCQFFNTYLIYINKTSNIQGQYCAIYSESWSPSYATNSGQWRGSDQYLIEYSFTGTNSSNPGAPNKQGAVYQARNDILWPGNSALPYCSSLLGYTTPVATTTTTATTTPQATVTTTFTEVDYRKRAVSTSSIPDALTKYPATVVSSGCALAVTPVTSTSTTTITAFATAPTNVQTVTVTVTQN